jgi:hypothetical protein
VVAVSTGLLSLAQNHPFVGPAAGALLMFYQTYEQCQENKELFEDLHKKVNYCKLWVEVMSDKKNLVSSYKVVVSSYKEFSLVFLRATSWLRQANKRFNENPSVLKGMILAEADQIVMTDHITRIDNSLMHFKTDISSLLLLNEEKSKLQTKLKDFLEPFEFKDTIYPLKSSFLVANAMMWRLVTVSWRILMYFG